MTFTAPSVIRKHGGRFAIITKKGRTLFQVIEMDSKKLIMRGHDNQELIKKGYTLTDMNPFAVAERFTKHQAGLTPNAMAALTELINDAHLY